MYIYVNISPNSFENENFFDTKVVQKIKTHILCSVFTTPPPRDNLAVCDKVWRKYGRDRQSTRMRALHDGLRLHAQNT